MVQITTSTLSTATAYSNQRKIDRTSNGVLWMIGNRPSGWGYFPLYYSTDNGATWTFGSDQPNVQTTANNYTPNASLFIDQDDYAHVVYKDNSNGYIYYRRGTPNAARTAWTWSAAVLVYGNSSSNYPDVTAHREGTGWVAHVILSYAAGTDNRALYWPVSITSAGAISVGSSASLAGGGFGYSNGNHTYPSIDFNHTGDGKTVAGGTPHLYVAWSAGGTGAGKGIRFKKATYSAGSWTWGTERELDSTLYCSSSGFWVNCLFDGARVLVGGYLTNGASYATMLYERDVEDTNTITRTLISPGTALENDTTYGSMSYDINGNVFMLGRDSTFGNFPDTNFVLRKWTRSSESFTKIIIDQVVVPYTSLARTSTDEVRFVFTDGSGSYTVNYGSFSLNSPPSVTFSSISKSDPREPITIDWDFSDADNDTQQDYELAYRVSGSGSSFTVAPVQGVGVYNRSVEALEPSLYYRLNETSGTTVNADAGPSGSYVGAGVGQGTSPVLGQKAIDKGYAVVPNWAAPQALTINCWFKCDPGELDDAIHYYSLWGFSPNNWDARFNTRRSVTFHAYAADGAWYNWGLTTGFDMDDGQWHMITLVWDGINGAWASYLDGVRNSGQAFTPQMPSQNSVDFYIAASGGARVWAGEAAEFSMFPSALSDTQVADLYAAVDDLAGLNSTHTIPANTLTDETVYEIRLRATDGTTWSDYVYGTLSADSWIYLPEQITANDFASIDTTTLTDFGEYEVEVRVTDADDTGEWSLPATFIYDYTTHQIYINGEWRPVRKQFRWLDQWIEGEIT